MHTYKADIHIDTWNKQQTEKFSRIPLLLPYPVTAYDYEKGEDITPTEAVPTYREYLEFDYPKYGYWEQGISFSVTFAVESVDEKFIREFVDREILAFFPHPREINAEVYCVDPEPPHFNVYRRDPKWNEHIKRNNAKHQEYHKRRQERSQKQWAKQKAKIEKQAQRRFT